MRKVLAITAVAVLMTSCGKASAAPHALDPTSDLDCALTTYYFYLDASERGAPEKVAKGLHITNQWFAASLKYRGQSPSEAEKDLVSQAVQSDMTAARTELKGCLARATQDSRFSAFADRMGW